ncbi:MAG: aldo/keto reductase, partial [Nitrospira sp.]|nr:aldo/keto reductase [Nitrospira sp.]
GFFSTAKQHEALILRTREGTDGATPSPNAIAASALSRLSVHFDRRDWRDAAVGAVRAYGRQMTRYPRAFARTLAVVDFLTQGPVELVFVGDETQEASCGLRRAVAEQYVPNRVIAAVRSDIASSLPLLAGKHLVQEKPALYICRDFNCLPPITDPADVAAAIQPRTADTVPNLHEPKMLQAASLPGKATVQGTAAYAARMIGLAGDPDLANGFTSFGGTGLTTTRLGFGTYRVTTQDDTHREALTKALRTSCNVIDTSTNYTDGESERLVGSVLAELIASGDVSRDEVVVVSKIGYVQGHNLQHAKKREQSGRAYPEMVKYGEGIWHCIHPEFLADQLSLSLDRLGLATLDICLLHNPEYFLSEATHRGVHDLTALRKVFYERLTQAFTYFESQVAAGRLQYYGVSSNTVAAPTDEGDTTSLAAMLDAAQTAAGLTGADTHHFRVIQFPMNLFEAGGAFTSNTGPSHRQTVLEYAQQAGVAALVNRPLNAMPTAHDGMLRLADHPGEDPHIHVARQLDTVETIEQEYHRLFSSAVQSSGQHTGTEELFHWSTQLRGARPQVRSLEHWEHIEQQIVIPQVTHALQIVSQQLTGALSEQWESWRTRYIHALSTLLQGLRYEATQLSRSRAATVTRTIDPLLPDDRRSESLSRKALWILAATSGITCVLTGMRTSQYVEDALAVLRWAPFDKSMEAYKQLQSTTIN